MNLPLYIAKRYFFSRKTTNVINLISVISLFGVAFGTAALIIVLSVFNGFEHLAGSMLNAFNPDLKVTVAKGKFFDYRPVAKTLKKFDSDIDTYSLTLEQNGLISYENKQYIGIIKGVDRHYPQVSGVDTMMLYGKFQLYYKGKRPMAIVGAGIANSLGVQLNFLGALQLWLPRTNAKLSYDVTQIFNRGYIFPSGIFSVQEEFDNKYVFVPLRFLQNLLEVDSNTVSAIEIKLKPQTKVESVEQKLRKFLGQTYKVQNRLEQEQIFYKIVHSERLAVIVILSFIIIIASFNIIATLSMLIIDKKEDIEVLDVLGANKALIKKIFLYEGLLIDLFGVIVGLIMGIVLILVQKHWGVIKYPSMGNLMYLSYPVILKLTDILITVLIVFVIGYFASRLPVNFFVKKYLSETEERGKL